MRHNGEVTPQQLETLVLAAVDCVRAGGPIEDDWIEVKRDWPGTEKARQLAGAANRARGNPMVYVVGLDEKTGKIHRTGETDVAVWWAQMASRFDQLPPELVRHLNVPVGSGESVTAILFATDRAPYVVNNIAGGSPEREVPIREGTRTRSATRDELLRMVRPEIGVPPVVLLAASITGQWNCAVAAVAGRPGPGRDESTSLSGFVDVFIEHVGPGGILLPLHEMVLEVSSGELRLKPTVTLHSPPKDAPPPPVFGVQVRHDGFASTGPGRARVNFSWFASGDSRVVFNAVEAWRLELKLGVTGSSRPVRIDASLKRSTKVRGETTGLELYESLSGWTFNRTDG
jgi:hypothetical protein